MATMKRLSCKNCEPTCFNNTVEYKSTNSRGWYNHINCENYSDRKCKCGCNNPEPKEPENE